MSLRFGRYPARYRNRHQYRPGINASSWKLKPQLGARFYLWCNRRLGNCRQRRGTALAGNRGPLRNSLTGLRQLRGPLRRNANRDRRGNKGWTGIHCNYLHRCLLRMALEARCCGISIWRGCHILPWSLRLRQRCLRSRLGRRG